MFKEREVFEATLEYFQGDELAANVWKDKYSLKNEGVFYELTPDDMHRRLAKEFARIEQNYPNPLSEEQIFYLLKGFKYIVPQGGPMAGIGNNFVTTSLSNCFVIGNGVDSYGGIMQIDEEQVQLMKRRGGVGHDLSHLRFSGAMAGGVPLGENAGTTLYMDRYSNSTREVQQDGRRGALMLSLSVSHPDVEKFIDKKMIPGKVTGANVSIKLSDDFMGSVKNNGKYQQTFNGEVIREVEAKSIWDKLIYNAWRNAEPGVLFWDKILSESPARGYGEEWKEISTNPCAELPLCSYDSCRLLSINLASYVIHPFTSDARLNTEMLVGHIGVAMRLLDDLIDLEVEKIDKILSKIEKGEEDEKIKRTERELWLKIRKKALDGRRTGLGYTGLGDMMAMLGITYGTEKARNFIEDLQKFFATAAYMTSIYLAETRGAFPIWEYEKDMESGFIKRMFDKSNWLLTEEIKDDYKKYGRRNIGLLTIAPTGTTSLMTQTTSGIEPLFSPFYYRKRKTGDPEKSIYTDEVGDMWEEYIVFHKPFVEWYIIHNKLGLSYREGLATLQTKTKAELDIIFEQSPYFKATAQDVDYIEKVRMQGAAQKWVDHSISVTVNMPENIGQSVVEDVYMQAWESGCKGVTVYREGSRGNVLSTKKTVAIAENFDYIAAFKRPKEVECDVYFKSHKKDEYILFVGIVDNKPYEMFGVPYKEETKIPKLIKRGVIKKVKKGVYQFVSDCGKYVISNVVEHMLETEQNETRSVSAMLRHRINPKYIVNVFEKFATITSFHKVLIKVLKNYIDDGNEKCPQCKDSLIMTDGCVKCPSCGWSQCG